MKNIDKWRLYTKALPSPDSFIEFGYYALVAAALQRRVWVGPSHMQLFPNLYTILCAQPGVGKSLVIKEIHSFLKHYKKKKPSVEKEPTIENTEKMKDFLKRDQENKGRPSNPHKAKVNEDPLVIPLAADTTTMEALIDSFVNSYDGIGYVDTDGSKKIYRHSSLCFCLEELSSLLKKKDEDVPKLLLKTYDCGDYDKRTRTNGNDYIKQCCLNFIAGTTPSFMQDVLSDKILNDGFSSRAFFIFEYANRSSEIFIPPLTIEQHMAKMELQMHIQALTRLYGFCEYTEEAKDYLTKWWRAFPTSPRPNNSLKLTSYYSRKNIHVQKLAMAIHFGEISEMGQPITLGEVTQAMALLDKAEQKMHYALSFGEKNPLAVGAKKVLTYMRARGHEVPFNDLWIELNDDLRKEELQEVMDFLIGTDQVMQSEKSKQTIYRIVPKETEAGS